jgi:hypothetical protein
MLQLMRNKSPNLSRDDNNHYNFTMFKVEQLNPYHIETSKELAM